jgi:hypothetical protein
MAFSNKKIGFISLFFLSQLAHKFYLTFANHANDVFLGFDVPLETTYNKNTIIPLHSRNDVGLSRSKNA